MESVVILGSTGMLGSTLTRYMERVFPSVTELNRMGRSVTGRNRSIEFDVLKDNNLSKSFLIPKFDKSKREINTFFNSVFCSFTF